MGKSIPEKVMFGIEVMNVVSIFCVTCSSNTEGILESLKDNTEIELYIFLKK